MKLSGLLKLFTPTAPAHNACPRCGDGRMLLKVDPAHPGLTQKICTACPFRMVYWRPADTAHRDDARDRQARILFGRHCRSDATRRYPSRKRLKLRF